VKSGYQDFLRSSLSEKLPPGNGNLPGINIKYTTPIGLLKMNRMKNSIGDNEQLLISRGNH